MGDLERGGDGSRCRDHVADEDAGIIRGERRASQIRAGECDVDGSPRIAGIRRKGRDRRRADAARIARDGQQIANSVVGVRRDIALPVDHLREPSQVVVDVLDLIGCGHHRVDEQERRNKHSNKQDSHFTHPFHHNSRVNY